MNIQLPDFTNANVLVVGDIMLDRYWHGPTSRISPEAPVPVVRIDEIEERAGGAGNVALNIVALGAKATLLGLTGDDEAADVLERHLGHEGVDCHFSRVEGISTVTKLRVLSKHQQLIRLDFEDGFGDFDANAFSKIFKKLLANADAVVFSDYGKGTMRDVTTLMKIARDASKPVFVDPKGADFTLYRSATGITPNLTEFEAVVGHCDNDGEIVDKGNALCQQHELGSLLVTRSDRGMTLMRRNEDALHLTAIAREVYDVTGAGDTVIAVLAAGQAADLDLATSTALANLAAGIVVGKLGTATASIEELRRAIRLQTETESGVMDRKALLLAVHDAKAHGEKIVFTNGCFDILHAGHVSYLEKSKRLGDRMVVAVNDDASVKKLKGESRPINALERRMQVLAGLQCVDWVVPFSEDTPEKLINELQPDVLVKGGDYKAEDIAGSETVQKNGGEVVVLDFEQGCSTSEIINVIKSKEG